MKTQVEQAASKTQVEQAQVDRTHVSPTYGDHIQMHGVAVRAKSLPSLSTDPVV